MNTSNCPDFIPESEDVPYPFCVNPGCEAKSTCACSLYGADDYTYGGLTGCRSHSGVFQNTYTRSFRDAG